MSNEEPERVLFCIINLSTCYCLFFWQIYRAICLVLCVFESISVARLEEMKTRGGWDAQRIEARSTSRSTAGSKRRTSANERERYLLRRRPFEQIDALPTGSTVQRRPLCSVRGFEGDFLTTNRRLNMDTLAIDRSILFWECSKRSLIGCTFFSRRRLSADVSLRWNSTNFHLLQLPRSSSCFDRILVDKIIAIKHHTDNHNEIV